MFNAKLKAVPGKAGHLYFTSGQQDGSPAPQYAPFLRSTNGGATWSAVPNVHEVHAYGYGKEASGSANLTIFIVGYVNGIYGFYRSTDNAATWTQIGDYPIYRVDFVRSIEGDKDIFGKVYVAFSGYGFAYGVSQ